MYIPTYKDGDRFTKPVDRKHLGQLDVYQPESDGYQVASFYKGGVFMFWIFTVSTINCILYLQEMSQY